MSDVVGDVRELVQNTITATATHSVTGQSGAFHFKLSEATGVRKYFSSHAKVTISGPVLFSVSGPVSSTVATTCVLAIVPDKYNTWPTTEEQILQLQGSTRVQHSLLVPPASVPVTFGNETAEQLKPKTLVDYPPVAVGHYTIAGGNAQSTAIIALRVPLTVDGVAHHKTW